MRGRRDGLISLAIARTRCNHVGVPIAPRKDARHLRLQIPTSCVEEALLRHYFVRRGACAGLSRTVPDPCLRRGMIRDPMLVWQNAIGRGFPHTIPQNFYDGT